MQELISALTAHEEECSREFEADLSAFCTRHMDAQLVQQLRQLVAEGEEDLAYRAFYALTIIYRNRTISSCRRCSRRIHALRGIPPITIC